MMPFRHAVLPFIALMTLSGGAVAVDLDIQPGDWEFTNVSRLLGDSPFPGQTTTNRQCITAEDIAKGPQFMDLSDDCEMSNLQVTSSSMSYDLVCRQHDMEVHMKADMSFQGDRLSGQVNAELETPMGIMPLQTDIQARRVGDCP
ncbi:hypothetical protein CKO35_12400 [Ectothiorhodospira shaposhnikovii]|uniref:DUF3617 domain-containing protein n=1 Tax=Ectothiorhodospira shaposhnikovii TaxID=1054 RepID=UPI00190361A9|nr:DUF3617 family protein [Ectothiorhodospira shaposhnikovii]MBK1674090.1 hypothetical protein [Ectothiorhodospira shaposhnikovii]